MKIAWDKWAKRKSCHLVLANIWAVWRYQQQWQVPWADNITVHSQLEIISKNVCVSPEHASGQLQIPMPGITTQYNTSYSWQATLCSSGPHWPILQLVNNKAISCPLAGTGSWVDFQGRKSRHTLLSDALLEGSADLVNDSYPPFQRGSVQSWGLYFQK